MHIRGSLSAASIGALLLASCGTHVPDQTPFVDYKIDPNNNSSTQGNYEIGIVNHIECELAKGLVQSRIWAVPWITSKDWGTAVTLTLTRLDQSGVNAGASFNDPLHNALRTLPAAVGGNVTTAQSFTLGVGATLAANASRTKTIQYTYRNSDIVSRHSHDALPIDCSRFQHGMMIDGDLRLADSLYDTVEIAASDDISDAAKSPSKKYPLLSQVPPFNTETEEVNFVAAAGGGVNPSWKLVNVSGNTSTNLLAGEITYTNDVVITVGPIKAGSIPLALDANAQAQHNSRVNANAIATSISGSAH